MKFERYGSGLLFIGLGVAAAFSGIAEEVAPAGLDAAPHLVLLPGLDGTGELFAPLLQALDDDVTASVVRYGAELTFDEYVEVGRQGAARAVRA